MPRLLFEKTGNGIWISHLDLMRLFQRAFKRAGLHLKHTQGFNPRPSVSIALPLSVGIESHCELLDFELEGEAVPVEQILQRLNQALPAGVRVLEAYENGRKLKELAFLRCQIRLEYDAGVPDGAQDAVHALFSRPSLIVPKKTKNGLQEQNIIPMLRRLQVGREGQQLLLDALLCCQNPTLNPMQLSAAISREIPEFAPDFSSCCRMVLYDINEQIFR